MEEHKLSLPTRIANEIIKNNKIKIGWVNCRIREKVSPIKCYKCLEYGHIIKTCKSLIDRSKNCLKCGQHGHFIKSYMNEEN